MPGGREARATAIRPDTLLGSVAVLLLVNVVQRSIGFGRGVLFCRWLAPESLGEWDMAYGFLLLAAPVAVLGLPGSFGRYIERYRQRGQLTSFLWRTCAWAGVLTSIAVLVLLLGRGWFAYLVFGDAGQSSLLVLVAVVLATVVLHHFLEAVFAGLRVFRVVSAMHFAQSMLFAGISLSLLLWWRCDAWSIVAGYGLACLVSASVAMVWARRFQWQSIEGVAADSHRDFWPPLIRFAVWVWITALLSNLFTVIDRYMIVHFSGLPADTALGLVGCYHTSMLVPVLLISVANLLTGAMTPHLSHQWETGDRDGAGKRIDTAFKLASLGMFLASLCVLAVAPALFHLAFGGKYDEGLFVLPWAVASCVWFSLLLVAQTYVWCAEESRHATLPMLIGLVGNVTLNLMLLPVLGLLGAVMATALATLLALLGQNLVNWRLGLTPTTGTFVAALLPLALAMGLPTAVATSGLIAFVVLFTPWMLSVDQCEEIVSVIRRHLGRLSWRRRGVLVQEG